MDRTADRLSRFARGTVQVDTWTRPDGEMFLSEARLPSDPHAALLDFSDADDGRLYVFPSVESAVTFALIHPEAAAAWYSDTRKQLAFDGQTLKLGASGRLWDQLDAVHAVLQRRFPHLLEGARREMQALVSTWEKVTTPRPVTVARMPRRRARHRRPRCHARRAAGIRAGQDPGDPDPPGGSPPAAPRLTLAPKPKACLTFGALALDRDLWHEVNR